MPSPTTDRFSSVDFFKFENTNVTSLMWCDVFDVHVAYEDVLGHVYDVYAYPLMTRFHIVKS